VVANHEVWNQGEGICVAEKQFRVKYNDADEGSVLRRLTKNDYHIHFQWGRLGK
jgi:hypothetical protein